MRQPGRAGLPARGLSKAEKHFAWAVSRERAGESAAQQRPLPGAPLPGAPLPGAPLPGAPLPGGSPPSDQRTLAVSGARGLVDHPLLASLGSTGPACSQAGKWPIWAQRTESGPPVGGQVFVPQPGAPAPRGPAEGKGIRCCQGCPLDP